MIECRRVDKEKAFFDEAGAYMDKNCFVWCVVECVLCIVC